MHRDAKPLAEAFHYCPQCGAGSSAAGSERRFECATCGFTVYFSPVTAVAGFVLNHDGQLLLLKRARDPGKGCYGLPGGFVDAGETAEEALEREVREEVNLTVTRTVYVTSFPNRYLYRGLAIAVTDLFYICEVESLAGLRADPGEVAGFEFCVPTDEHLRRMAFESNRRATRLYLESR